MNTFWTSDTHYDHTNILSYSQRPFDDIESMNEALIENYNKVVKKGDMVFHLGDFAFSKTNRIKEIIKRLNGQKHLILGNHDAKTIGKSPSKFLGKDLFQSIQWYKTIKIGEQKICLLHFPMRSWEKRNGGSIHLHGHCHNNIKPFGKSVDIGVDAKFITDEYRPLEFEEIKTFMATRPIYDEDDREKNIKQSDDK